MKNAVILLCLLFLLGCTKEYDLSERYSISTKVVDINNNPIPNVEVGVYFVFNETVDFPTPYFSAMYKGLFWTVRDDTDLISTAFTDENGFVTLSFPLPKTSFETIRLVVADENDPYLDFTLAEITKEGFTANLLEIPLLQLVKPEEVVGLEITNAIEEEGYFLQSYQLDASAFYSFLPFENLTITPSFTQSTFFSVLRNQPVNISIQVINTNLNPAETIAFTDQISIEEDFIEYQIQLP